MIEPRAQPQRRRHLQLTVCGSGDEYKLPSTRSLCPLCYSEGEVTVSTLRAKDDVTASSSCVHHGRILGIAYANTQDPRDDIMTQDGRKLCSISNNDSDGMSTAERFADEALA